MNKKKQPSPYFQTLVDHINDTWKAKKGFGYPFQGKEFRGLKSAARNFKEWGLMAMWDAFLKSDSEWIKTTGYSISAFLGSLVWLVDDKEWKHKAKEYEKKMVPEYPKDILSLLKGKI